jgi:hypothetical protein
MLWPRRLYQQEQQYNLDMCVCEIFAPSRGFQLQAISGGWNNEQQNLSPKLVTCAQVLERKEVLCWTGSNYDSLPRMCGFLPASMQVIELLNNPPFAKMCN